MEYDVILRNGEYVLLSTECNYIVACGYDPTQRVGEQWRYGNYFSHFGAEDVKPKMLSLAVDAFNVLINSDYIPRCRLEELATQFKDGLIEDDEYEAIEYFNEVCEMTDEEKEFFGIKTESEDE